MLDGFKEKSSDLRKKYSEMGFRIIRRPQISPHLTLYSARSIPQFDSHGSFREELLNEVLTNILRLCASLPALLLCSFTH